MDVLRYEPGPRQMRYELSVKSGAGGFTLYVNNPLEQTITYDPKTGEFELEVFEQLPERPNLPRLVSRLKVAIRPKP